MTYLAQAIFESRPQNLNTLNPQTVGGSSQQTTRNLQQTPATLNQMRATTTPSSGIALNGITTESQVRQELEATTATPQGKIDVVLVVLFVLIVLAITALVRKSSHASAKL